VSKCRVDSDPTLLAGATETAGPIVSITYKSTSNGGPFAQVPVAGVPDQPRGEDSCAERYLDDDRSARPHCHWIPFRSSVRVDHLHERCGWFCASQNSEFYGPVAATYVCWRSMIATCANPFCNVPFRYFRSGKIFVLDGNEVDPRSRTDCPKRRIEYFWLCGECGPTMRLMRTTDGAVTVCESSRFFHPLGPPRITFAREATWLKAAMA
jgi:hypothetical protein